MVMKEKVITESRAPKNRKKYPSIPDQMDRITVTIRINNGAARLGILSFSESPWLLVNCSSLEKRVRFAKVTTKGTITMVPQKTMLLGWLREKTACNTQESNHPRLIPSQKIRFQRLSLFIRDLMKSFIGKARNCWFQVHEYIISYMHAFAKRIKPLMLVFFLGLWVNNAMASSANIKGFEKVSAIISLAEKKHDIPPGLLSAIAKVESGTRPYALNLGGRSVFARTISEAVSYIKSALSSGKTNIDIGVMQLNYRWHGKQFNDLETMLAPASNIEYAAKLLRKLYKRHGSWQEAVRHYHSSNTKHNRKYSRKVTLSWIKEEARARANINY